MFDHDFDSGIDETWNPNYYADSEVTFREEEDARLQQLPWLTEAERSPFRLGDHPRYPGLYAEPHEYDAFAQTLRETCSRILPCQYRTPSFSIRGGLDVVSGVTYLLEENRYVLTDEELPNVVDIQFGDDEPALLLKGITVTEGCVRIEGSTRDTQPPRSLSDVLRDRTQAISARALGDIVQALERKGSLPSIVASVRGKRTNQFYPF